MIRVERCDHPYGHSGPHGTNQTRIEAGAAAIDVERLAAIEHDQWIEWSKTIAREGLTPERIARWERYWVPYADLDEATKEHDRKWARLVLAAIEEKK
jgi:hypothetical protein